MTKATVSAVSAIAALVLPLIGRSVLVADKAGAEIEFKIAKLSDKLGSLKDGTKGEYVVLQSSADEAVVINVHPASAKRLVTKGEESGMKLVPTAEASTETTEAGATEEVAGTTDAAPEAAAEPKAPSKKEQFMAAYNAGVAAGSDRKTIKAAVADLGLSDAGFNTYYQNAKSGKWA